MTIALTAAQARRLRLRAQHLETGTAPDPASLVYSLGAVQAQDWTAAQLAVRVRTEDLTADAVGRACMAERTVVRTWALRGTLHLVPAEDLQWMLRLLGPAMIRKSRRRHRELGLTEDVYAQAVAVMRHLLEGQGPCPRGQIAACLVRHGLPGEGQAVPHLLRRASLDSVICFGPMADGQATYTLLETWLPTAGQEVEEPVVALARRYMAAYAPAAPGDFQAWSGLSAAQTRRAFAALAAETPDDRPRNPAEYAVYRRRLDAVIDCLAGILGQLPQWSSPRFLGQGTRIRFMLNRGAPWPAPELLARLQTSVRTQCGLELVLKSWPDA